MRLFLIRHGETVDNVAGLYAGSRDSALTNHGIQQARRLGEFLAKNKPGMTHLFASPLQRAYKTADALRAAQAAGEGEHAALKIVSVPQLVEQDFGFYEGKPFYARSKDSGKTGRDAHHEDHKNDPGFVDVESKESLATRCGIFLDQHLLPLLDEPGKEESVVAIVSHGILLSHLWRGLLRRLPAKSVTIAPDVLAAQVTVVLEHLGGWGNTGYLELVMQNPPRSAAESVPLPASGPSTAAVDAETPADHAEANSAKDTAAQVIIAEAEEAIESQPIQTAATSSSSSLAGYTTLIVTINGKEHLKTLKRTRGGIGRARYDEGQKTIESFFKRPKTT